ncbi:energy-coupling factor ABC transporter ATP-binding protein [Paenibacillus sp. Aloe-11]|uniref:energy-coupling factor ABC transporter ATP-binding protein n=1 Tax=Paenibacillus sp. Aloe-11 TaxID=1050222 RepID=UPI00024EFCBB|nr:ABC transporter ATP-binding protein [Paenibacillus sp. Aloe-11]EHS55908.1 ABC transporter-like protein [Paenibacillus sp. Aloe-11]
MALLSLNQVSFRYPNGTKAVDHISMSFQAGEKVAIIGQNGAGKTTAVKLMNGLLKPSSGTVIVDGWDTKDHTTAQISSKVGYVFQNPDDQLFHETIYEEVAFSTRHLKVDAAEAKRMIATALELTGLTEYATLHPYSLPYSMRKFVTIAAVIAMQSKVIILDEPTAGQDRRSLDRLTRIIDYLTQEGKTVITITHDMAYVANHFKRVIVMANQHVISDSTAQEIFWQSALMQESHIQAPPVSQLASALHWPGQIVTVDEFVEYGKGQS